MSHPLSPASVLLIRELKVAETAAWAAGRELMLRYRCPPTNLEIKRDPGDLVSEADRAAETAIRAILLGAYPSDEILGEEQGCTPGSSGVRWVVDPLDSTANYLRGLPCWSVSVACEDAQGLLLGAVYDPVGEELFSVARGGEVLINGQIAPPALYTASDLGAALFSGAVRSLSSARASRVSAAESICGQRRGFGSGALMCAWAAVGRIDLVYYEIAHLAQWDVAAGILLCQAAGLRAEWLPPAADGIHPRFLAARPALFDAWLQLTN